MTDNLKLKIISWLVILFRFGVPLFIITTTYISKDTSPKVTISVIGMVLLTILALSLLKYAKKRIVIRQQSGFKPSPYKVMVINYLPSTIILVAFTVLLRSIENDMKTLVNVMTVISISVLISFIISFAQVHYEKKVV
jgi:hypothetical protein